VSRGQLPQRAGSLGLNGSGTATAVPPAVLGLACISPPTTKQLINGAYICELVSVIEEDVFNNFTYFHCS